MKKEKPTWYVKKFDVPGFNKGWGCGYVVIHKGHPFYEKNYHFIDDFVSVHYGLTYGERAGEEYVIGFDTWHFMDTLGNCPKEFVEQEAERLCEQVSKYGNKFYYFYKWLILKKWKKSYY